MDNNIVPNEKPRCSTNGNMVQVQQVTKKSSDELLRKFAVEEEEEEEKVKTRMRTRRSEGRRTTRSGEDGSGVVVERRSLLPKKSASLVKFGRSHLRRAKDMRNKSFLAGFQKTWRMTMEGASRVLLEKHYNRHKLLISDMV